MQQRQDFSLTRQCYSHVRHRTSKVRRSGLMWICETLLHCDTALAKTLGEGSCIIRAGHDFNRRDPGSRCQPVCA